MTTERAVKPNPAWKIALVGAPLFLLLSSAGAMWIWWNRSQDTRPDPRLALVSSEVQVAELDDHLRKLGDLIGPREWETPEGRQNMRRAIAFIEGTLSPQNYGFSVQKGVYKSMGEDRWPTIWVSLEGSENSDEVVLVATPYDRGDASLATVLCAANDLRNEEFGTTVRFVFVPSLLFAEEETELTEVLEDGQTLRELLEPDLSGVAGLGAERRGATGVDLKSPAVDLVEKVRESAR